MKGLLSNILFPVLFLTLFWWSGTLVVEVEPIGEQIFGQRWDFFQGAMSENTARTVAAALILIGAVLMLNLTIKEEIYPEKNYMPSALFTIIATTLYLGEISLSPLLATVLIIIALHYGLGRFRVQTPALRDTFTMGVYLGGAVLVYPPALYLLPIMALILLLTLSNIRFWITLIGALLIPMSMYFFTLWVVNQWDFNVVIDKLDIYHRAFTLNDRTIGELEHIKLQDVIPTVALVALTLLVSMLSVITFLFRRTAQKRYSQVSYTLFVYLAIWVAGVAIISPVRTLYMAIIIAMPLCVVAPYFFSVATKRKLLSKTLYWLLIVSGIGVQLWDVIENG